jgi:hypothetical protein
MPPKDLNEEQDVAKKVTATHPVSQHFVQNNTESPEVGLKAILMVKEDFRGRESRCSNLGSNSAAREMCFRSTVAKQSGDTKVAEDELEDEEAIR